MRITRITPNQNNNKISDTMQIAGFTEVIDAKIRYPNTALLYIEFSAEQFRSIPAVTVETKLKKCRCRATTTLCRARTVAFGTAPSSRIMMRITRITPNQNNNKISDTMQIAGFTEVIDAKI
ncbi:TipJ family phage tail tip protein, partial [Corynebacterium diphtheriae]